MSKHRAALWAALIGLAVLVPLVPEGCTDQGGVHVWDRCTSFIATRAPSFADLFGLDSTANAGIALVAALLVAVVSYFLLAAAGRR